MFNKSFFKRVLLSRKSTIVFLIVAMVAVGTVGFYIWQKGESEAPRPSYIQGYRLINEKISQSAAIIISLPEGIEKAIAQKNISFFPEVEGKWLKSDNEGEIVFKPNDKLELSRYYSVQLALNKDGEEGVMKVDFLAVEDPEIVAVFPREGSETPEDSEITIIFNRPMVPLTTLGFLEEKDIPVEITPKTEGRFKWITTRNLQFIPEDRLFRSSNYEVKIKPGLVSMDGLDLGGKEIQFTTRKLRYLNLTKDKISYNQPISIYFNQPVNLEKTKSEISLRGSRTGKEIPFIAEYLGESEGTSERDSNNKSWFFGSVNLSNLTAKISSNKFTLNFFGREKEEEKSGVNKSIIQVYNLKDRFDRERFWDFGENYSLQIKKAYPVEGDITLNERRTTNINVADVIKNIAAESERTKYADLSFFDPQGKIRVDFYEEIDLGKSNINVQKVKDIYYGEKCKDEDRQVSSGVECEKETDRKRIYITFKEEEIGKNESLDIKFEKVVNVGGLSINRNPILKRITSFPEFRVLSTYPGNNSSEANLTGLTVCSNSPISSPAREDLKNYLKANLDYEINYWSNSYKVYYSHSECNSGEFQTRIGYGLIPFADYTLQLELEDVFGQKASHSLEFTTGLMPSSQLSFYHFQKSYNVTVPDKTSLTYAVQNMEYINLHICKLEAKDFLRYIENQPRYYESPSSIYGCQGVVNTVVYLPKKYWIKNYFQVNIENYFSNPIGHYIVTLSHPNYRERWSSKRMIYERTSLTVTNLAVTEKRIDPQYATFGSRQALDSNQLNKLNNLYWVTDLESMEPVTGATIELYQGTKGSSMMSLAGSFTTDDQGIALTDITYDLEGVVVSKGNDSTIISERGSKLQYANNAFSAKKIYIYTDRPIYRPGDEVFLKGIYRIGYDGDYEIYRDKNVSLKVYNSKRDEILERELAVNEFGSFDTKIFLDKGAPLGSYRVCADSYSCVYFDVQEYVPAAFEVKVETDKEEYISKDTANLTVEANYYFGVPLEGGEVIYTISSQDYYFDRYSDGYFNFGSGWYYWYPRSYGDKFILRDKVSLGSDGKARISQKFDIEELFKNEGDRKSKIILVDVTVKTSQGQSVSAQKSFIVHAGDLYLGLRADKSFLGKNEKTNFKVKTVDTKGKEISVNDVSLNLYRIKWSRIKRLSSDGGYHYKWEKERELVKNYHFNTDRNGNHVQEIQLDTEGSYEAEAKVRDVRGNSVSTTYNFYVYGKGSVSVKPTKDTTLEIETEKIDLKVGEKASLVIKSPFEKAKALISIERGKIFNYEIKEIEGNLYNYDFEIKEEYLPNVYASVLLLSPEPEVKFGKVEFKIDTERKELNIDVSSNKTQYLPGEEVTLDIITKDYAGRPVSSELSLSVVDLSVLALKGNPKKNPLVFFYGGFPLTVSTASNIKDILVETEVKTKGGGGLAAEDEGLARKKRGEFRDTAFWQAVVRTDGNGRAQVKFTLPDNLTTWQAEVVGITKDTKTGVDYQEFLTRKDIMLVPLRPRFVIPGDIFYIGAKIFNQSGEKQRLEVRFDSSTLLLEQKDREEKITLKSGETETVYFKVQAAPQLDTGEHKFVLSARNDELEDTIEQSIVITKNDTYEVTATAHYTSDSIVKEYVFLPDNVVRNKGDLSIKSSATLAVFLSDSLNYLLRFPYGCSEQIASKLNAMAVVKKGLNLPNLGDKFKLDKIKYGKKEYTLEEAVEMGLAELYNNQKWDGGFSYWRTGKSNFYLTLHIVNTLHNLSLAGFEINQGILNKASSYIYNKVTKDKDIYNDNNSVILAVYTLFRLPDFDKRNPLENRIINIAEDELFIKEQVSNTSLSYLAIILSEGFDEELKNEIYDVLDNRIDIDARGAFLESSKRIMWSYYETPIKNTSLYLKAQVADERENPIAEKVLRWILNNRSKDGAWGSTNNTLSAISALTDFLQWKRETESEFTLELAINGESVGDYNFQPETILDQFEKKVFLSDLKFNQINIVQFSKTNNNDLPNNFYYDMALKYYLPADRIPPRDEGFSITRNLYRLDDKENKEPLTEAKVGDILRGHIQITVPADRNFVMIEDYIPAGMEIVNLDLATEEKSLRLQEKELEGRELRPDFKEIHDDRVFLYEERLRPGVYEFDYYVRVLVKGKFTYLPAHVSEMYFPENFGRTDGRYFTIK